jgi:hypothetical protein
MKIDNRNLVENYLNSAAKEATEALMQSLKREKAPLPERYLPPNHACAGMFVEWKMRASQWKADMTVFPTMMQTFGHDQSSNNIAAGTFSFMSIAAQGVNVASMRTPAEGAAMAAQFFDTLPPKSPALVNQNWNFALVDGKSILRLKDGKGEVVLGSFSKYVKHVDEWSVTVQRPGEGVKKYMKEAGYEKWKQVDPSTCPSHPKQVCWGSLFDPLDSEEGNGYLRSCLDSGTTDSKGHKCGHGFGCHKATLKVRQAMQSHPVMQGQQDTGKGKGKDSTGGRGQGWQDTGKGKGGKNAGRPFGRGR